MSVTAMILAIAHAPDSGHVMPHVTPHATPLK
jgi:hypothetical protein